MGDAVLVLLILYAMAFYYYGPRAIALGLWSACISAAADIVCVKVRRRKIHYRDLSPIVTGLLIPLMMPATVPYHVVAAAALVAIVVAKHPFGGVGHNVFNPAAAGFSFAAICFGQALFVYPNPLQKLPVFLNAELEIVTGISTAFTLRLGGTPQYELVDMALGNFPGPMGATNILVILACLLYLVFRGTVRWQMPLSFFATVFLFALLFPRLDASRLMSVGYEMMSGLLLFGGVFLLGDPVTTPKRDLSKVAFGFASGVVVMLYRRFGNMEEGFTFAILLMNASVWTFDMLGERLYCKLRRRGLEVLEDKKVQKKA